MAYHKHLAIHEAGHVIVARCVGLPTPSVKVVGASYKTICDDLDFFNTEPWRIAFMKRAGAIAVKLQNERESESDPNGYETQSAGRSDKEDIQNIFEYLRYWDNNIDEVQKLREIDLEVRKILEDEWKIVEAIAAKIAEFPACGGELSASKIKKIIAEVEAKSKK